MFFLYCLDIISKNGPFNFIKIFNNFSEKIKNNFNNDFYHQKLNGLVLCLIPYIIFISMIVVEYASYKFNIGLLMPVIITAQVGSKIIEMTFIPTLFLISISLKGYMDRKYDYLLYPSFLIVILTLVLGLHLGENKLEKLKSYHFVYTNTINNYLDMIELSMPINNKYNPAFHKSRINNNDSISGNTYLNVNTLSDIKSIDKQFKKYLIEDVEYYHKYNNFEVLKDIVHAINKNVPKNSGIIVPIYVDMWRDCLPYHCVFFVEGIDGNLNMASPQIASALLHRMEMLLGAVYKELPPSTSGLLYSKMRELYLNIDEERLYRLNDEYPLYKYFLTETSHRLSLPIIFSNENYIIYKLP